MNAQEAKNAIEADRKKRGQAAMAEYNQFLEDWQKRHDVVLVPKPVFTPDGRVSAVNEILVN